MRFVVLGAGAIGGAVGARLFQAGDDVTLVARGEHGRALEESGLRFEAPGETVTLPIPTVSEPALVTWTDDTVVLLGVKGQHTEYALTQLSVAPPSIAVVCLQNGVENERRVLRHFADTYGVCVMCPATQLRPGVIQVHSAPVSGMLDLGRFPSGLDDRGQAIADALAATAFQSIARPDIMRWKYRKLLMNLANAAEALCRAGGPVQSPGQGGAARRGGARWLRPASTWPAPRRTGSDGATTSRWPPPHRASGRAGRAGRAWPAGPAPSRPSSSTGRSSCWAASTVCPTPVNALLERLAVRAAAEISRRVTWTIEALSEEAGVAHAE